MIDVNLGDVLRLATAHREALLVGDAPIRAPDVAMPPAAPAPVIERVDVLLIANSCWPEGDQMVSGARWSLRPVPVGIVATRRSSAGFSGATAKPYSACSIPARS